MERWGQHHGNQQTQQHRNLNGRGTVQDQQQDGTGDEPESNSSSRLKEGGGEHGSLNC